jgi:hypothetical protein
MTTEEDNASSSAPWTAAIWEYNNDKHTYAAWNICNRLGKDMWYQYSMVYGVSMCKGLYIKGSTWRGSASTWNGNYGVPCPEIIEATEKVWTVAGKYAFIKTIWIRKHCGKIGAYCEDKVTTDRKCRNKC